MRGLREIRWGKTRSGRYRRGREDWADTIVVRGCHGRHPGQRPVRRAPDRPRATPGSVRVVLPRRRCAPSPATCWPGWGWSSRSGRSAPSPRRTRTCSRHAPPRPSRSGPCHIRHPVSGPVTRTTRTAGRVLSAVPSPARHDPVPYDDRPHRCVRPPNGAAPYVTPTGPSCRPSPRSPKPPGPPRTRDCPSSARTKPREGTRPRLPGGGTTGAAIRKARPIPHRSVGPSRTRPRPPRPPRRYDTIRTGT